MSEYIRKDKLFLSSIEQCYFEHRMHALRYSPIPIRIVFFGNVSIYLIFAQATVANACTATNYQHKEKRTHYAFILVSGLLSRIFDAYNFC